MNKFDYFNEIYREHGFKAVIQEIDNILEYGGVNSNGDGIYCITTGGWSDDEYLINWLISPESELGRKHYIGYLRGGAYYFSEQDYYDSNVDIVSLNGRFYRLYGVFDTVNHKIIAWCNDYYDAELLIEEKGIGTLQINEYDVDIRLWRLQKQNCRRRGTL